MARGKEVSRYMRLLDLPDEAQVVYMETSGINNAVAERITVKTAKEMREILMKSYWVEQWNATRDDNTFHLLPERTFAC